MHTEQADLISVLLAITFLGRIIVTKMTPIKEIIELGA